MYLLFANREYRMNIRATPNKSIQIKSNKLQSKWAKIAQKPCVHITNGLILLNFNFCGDINMALPRLKQPSNIVFRFISKEEASDMKKVQALAEETTAMINCAWEEKNVCAKDQAYRKTGAKRTSVEAMVERIQNRDDYRICLANDTDKNKIIGIACIERDDDQVSHKGDRIKSAEFFLFSILKEYCGGKISKDFLEFVIPEAEKEFKSSEVHLTVVARLSGLVRFYLNNGFTLSPRPKDLSLKHIIKDPSMLNPQGEEFLYLSRSIPKKTVAVKTREEVGSFLASDSSTLVSLKNKLNEIDKKYQAKGLEPQLSTADLLTLLTLKCFENPQTALLSLLKKTIELQIEAAQLTAYYSSYVKPIKYKDALFKKANPAALTPKRTLELSAVHAVKNG